MSDLRRAASLAFNGPMRAAAGIGLCVLLAVPTACGDDSSPSPEDAGSGGGTDAGTVVDSGSGGGTDAGGGGSTVGMICANDSNCTGAGEICCLESDPFHCTLEADCDTTSGGIPCEGKTDCPNSRVCCRLPTDQFCTTRNACSDFGGDEVP